MNFVPNCVYDVMWIDNRLGLKVQREDLLYYLSELYKYIFLFRHMNNAGH